MKKVIDASALRSDELREFLCASKRNLAVLTDYSFRESFKGRGETNVRKSYEILAAHTDQVIVLKDTASISHLDPRAKGLQGRLVGTKETADFPRYCKALYSNSPGISDDIRSKQDKANHFFDQSDASTETLRRGMGMIIKGYQPDDIKRLRANQPLSQTLKDKFIGDVARTSALQWRNVNPGRPLPAVADIKYSFLFRYIVCGFTLGLKWAAEGGLEAVQTSRLKNDFTDMTYAAFATFFDGLITRDKKLDEVHRRSVSLLNDLFDIPKPPVNR